ncbi:MAG: hypothetical protein AB1656_24225 [Candidatus Omnitrophota bacterium]
MNEMNASVEAQKDRTSDAPVRAIPERSGEREEKRTILGLQLWEIVCLAISALLIALIAIPNYFDALFMWRGVECSARLTLAANCLTYLANKNHTKPGEKICELFELNEIMEKSQGGAVIRLDKSNPPYFKLGAEPDCIDVGDYKYSLILGQDGKIVIPTCSLGEGPAGEKNRKRSLHICDVSKVDGVLNFAK